MKINKIVLIVFFVILFFVFGISKKEIPKEIVISLPFNSEKIIRVEKEDIDKIYSYVESYNSLDELVVINIASSITVSYEINDNHVNISINDDGKAKKIIDDKTEYVVYDEEIYHFLKEYFRNH